MAPTPERRALSADDRARISARADRALAAADAGLRRLGPQWAPWAAAVALVLGALWCTVAAGLETPWRALVATAAGGGVFLSAVLVDVGGAVAHRRAVARQWAGILAEAEQTGALELRADATRAVSLSDGAWLLALADGWWLILEPPWDAPVPAPRARIRWLRLGPVSVLETDGDPIPTERVDGVELPDDHPVALRWGPAVYRATGDPIDGLLAFADGSFPLPTEPRGA